MALVRLYGCSVSSEHLMVAPVMHTKYVCVDIYMYFSSHAAKIDIASLHTFYIRIENES